MMAMVEQCEVQGSVKGKVVQEKWYDKLSRRRNEEIHVIEEVQFWRMHENREDIEIHHADESPREWGGKRNCRCQT